MTEQRHSSTATGFSRKKFRLAEFIIERGITGVAFVSLAAIVLIFAFVFREAGAVFSVEKPGAVSTAAPVEMETYGAEMASDGGAESQTDQPAAAEQGAGNTSFWGLFGSVWQPVSQDPRFGILPLIAGSLKVALIAMLLAGPIAVGAALYTTTFAPKWVREVVKPVVEILAGFPSVVIGFFALMVLATLMQQVFHFQYRLNAFVGGVALALAVIPVVFTITEDALAAVPRSYVEASLALGAEKWQTSLFVVFPAAVPGIFAAMLLGLGRAVGETMILLMATGNAALLSFNPVEPVRTMAATIGAEMAEVVFGDFHYSALFFIGVVLFAFSFLINLVAETVVRGLMMRKYAGA